MYEIFISGFSFKVTQELNVFGGSLEITPTVLLIFAQNEFKKRLRGSCYEYQEKWYYNMDYGNFYLFFLIFNFQIF